VSAAGTSKSGSVPTQKSRRNALEKINFLSRPVRNQRVLSEKQLFQARKLAEAPCFGGQCCKFGEKVRT
jgi:hypothetical protein